MGNVAQQLHFRYLDSWAAVLNQSSRRIKLRQLRKDTKVQPPGTEASRSAVRLLAAIKVLVRDDHASVEFKILGRRKCCFPHASVSRGTLFVLPNELVNSIRKLQCEKHYTVQNVRWSIRRSLLNSCNETLLNSEWQARPQLSIWLVLIAVQLFELVAGLDSTTWQHCLSENTGCFELATASLDVLKFDLYRELL